MPKISHLESQLISRNYQLERDAVQRAKNKKTFWGKIRNLAAKTMKAITPQFTLEFRGNSSMPEYYHQERKLFRLISNGKLPKKVHLIFTPKEYVGQICPSETLKDDTSDAIFQSITHLTIEGSTREDAVRLAAISEMLPKLPNLKSLTVIMTGPAEKKAQTLSLLNAEKLPAIPGLKKIYVKGHFDFNIHSDQISSMRSGFPNGRVRFSSKLASQSQEVNQDQYQDQAPRANFNQPNEVDQGSAARARFTPRNNSTTSFEF